MNTATVRAAFAFEPCLCKGEAPMPKGQRGPMLRIKAIVAPWLAGQADAAVAWGERMLQHAQKYAPTATPLQVQTLTKSSADEPDFDMGALFDQIAEQLVDAALNSVSDIEATMGVDLVSAPSAATAFARDRAARLVGKKIIGGQIIDNPNGAFAISDTLRGVVRDTVTKAIAEGWSPDKLASSLRSEFGDWRAETIARTETAFAYGNAAAEGYKELGVEYLEIVDGAGCLPQGHDDGAPEPSGDRGVIEEDAQADGQIWTVEQYQENPIGHPNCIRAAVPTASDESGDEA